MKKSRGRRSAWSATCRWPANCNFGCCRSSCPSCHLDVAAKFAPARAIGGDLYDFVNYSLRLGMVIGDVSGKGAPAAIYAALVSGILRSHAPIEPGPAEMLRAVNFSLASGASRPSSSP